MTVCINFGAIQVNEFDNNSGFFFGENQQNNWTAHSKTNDGFGAVSGNGNSFPNIISTVNDCDGVDAPANTMNASSSTDVEPAGVCPSAIIPPAIIK